LLRSDKSRYLARAGFKLANLELLDRAIRTLAASVEAVEDTADEYGTAYTVTGDLIGPTGKRLAVIVVWIRRTDGQYRFVTLKPNKDKRV
jgi:hypothetical protein